MEDVSTFDLGVLSKIYNSKRIQLYEIHEIYCTPLPKNYQISYLQRMRIIFYLKEYINFYCMSCIFSNTPL